MANQKLTDLTATTTPVDADLLYVVQDVATTPVSKKVTMADVKGSINISELGDTSIASAVVDEVLSWNGTDWVNKSVSQINAGAGVNVYLDDTLTVDNYGGLLRMPDATSSEKIDTAAFTGVAGTKFIEGYLYNRAENRTKWDAGVWRFNMFCSVNDNDKVSEIIVGVYMVEDFGGYPASTIKMTGTGTTRTATVTGSTPFVAGDNNADQILTSYIQTVSGTFKVTGVTSSSVVSIETPSGYTNDDGVAFSIHRYKFQTTTGEITGSTLTLYSTISVQPEHVLPTINSTLAIRVYGKTTSTKNQINVNFSHNGTTHYSYIETPFQQRHNDLAGLNLEDYQHLSAAQKTIATRAATTDVDGYLTSTDWDTFNGKQNALTFGIGDDNAVQIDSASVADDDFAKFTATGLEGRSASEVLGDIGALPTAGGTMAGNITLGENTSIAHDPSLSADGKYTGLTITGTAGAALAFGDLVTLDKDDSKWEKVDISAAAAATGDARGIIGICVLAANENAATNILLNGVIRADANFPALTIGAAVYASTTGDVVVSRPSTTDYVIRIVGFGLTADSMLFCPENDYITPV